MVEARSLHIGDTVCIAEAWSAKWRPSLPSKSGRLVAGKQRFMASGVPSLVGRSRRTRVYRMEGVGELGVTG